VSVRAIEETVHILISAQETPDPGVAAAAVLKFIDDNGIEVLNVAGPRASGWVAGRVRVCAGCYQRRDIVTLNR
jgi:hypothetical protein